MCWDLLTTREKMRIKNMMLLEIPCANGIVGIMPEFGRILGIWPNVNYPSNFWINDNFYNNERENLSWNNPGGHRVWLGPERDFFIKDLSRPFDTYQVPPEIDPGNYIFSVENNLIELQNHGKLTSNLSGQTSNFEIRRQIKVCKNKLIENILAIYTDVSITGYSEEITTYAESNGFEMASWSLIQVPMRGTIIIPTRGEAEYTVLFGKPDKAKLQLNYNYIILNCDENYNSTFKLGFKTNFLKGILLYEFPLNQNLSQLIIEEFDIENGPGYIDTPWDVPQDRGYVAQIFFGADWGFCELETHGAEQKDTNGHSISKTKITVAAILGQKSKISDILRSFVGK